jgi:hypothetical protein
MCLRSSEQTKPQRMRTNYVSEKHHWYDQCWSKCLGLEYDTNIPQMKLDFRNKTGYWLCRGKVVQIHVKVHS